MNEINRPHFAVPVTREEDRFACAAEGIQIGRWAGLSDRAQQELAIAIAELVSNAVRHGGGGTVEIRPVLGENSPGELRWGVEVIVRDSGPGLDPKLTMEEARRGDAPPPSTRTGLPRMPGQGLGLGLGAVYRLMSSVIIRSSPGVSTEVTAIKWG